MSDLENLFIPVLPFQPVFCHLILLCTFLHIPIYHRKTIVLCFYFYKLPCFKFSFTVFEMLFTKFIKCDTIYTICHRITIIGLFNCSLIDRLLDYFNFNITFTNNTGVTILYLTLYLLKLSSQDSIEK